MTIFNFGSINIDHVYQLPHFVRPGETLAASHYQTLLGGKGANQSIALAKAGCEVVHVGAIGATDRQLLAELSACGVNTEQVALLDQPSGHAIIQVEPQGENAIVLFAGANHGLTQAQIDRVLDRATAADWVLLQNETNHTDTIVHGAKQRGLTVVYNPAPMDKTRVKPLLPHIDMLIVNEVEALDLSGVDNITEAMTLLQTQYPQLSLILTLGDKGVCHSKGGTNRPPDRVAAFKVDAIDTTAAGDTFIGYCLAGLIAGLDSHKVLIQACAAAALCVTRAGASKAIPEQSEVQQFLQPFIQPGRQPSQQQGSHNET